ncbi:outer membrane protein assembly factor BamE [Rahnella sp. Lac-M11]|uniref:Outer membrane protein assembly factor BamE n=1 Tax=Rahnella contaminans TaxID=2703882 RepID=A0A6M2B678_9GAMM|nr:OmpA family protein [Rahnella contaminans]NGX88535.1 outer membrane protein assembly factor BamE [Rahnella contaminans]
MNKKQAGLAAVMGCVLLLAGCTHSVSNVDSQGMTDKPVFPDMASAVRTEGSFVNIDNLKQVRKGDTKAQLYELIGTPHFYEGTFRVKEWNYIFHFTKADNSVLTCQYKVLFDSHMKAQSFYFLPENCLSLLNAKKAVPALPASVAHQEFTAESLFAFGSASLSPAGVSQVQKMAQGLKAADPGDRNVVVSAYTDRIGKPADNLRLSQARADSVKQLLVAGGIPASHIVTRGLGDSEPRVRCDGSKSPTVIDCLAPNRRMVVDVVNAR